VRAVRDQPEQQAPPVQRLRIRYAKRGRLRFTSHRDFSRAFERAIVRARVPMAYSSGFNPHPRISYTGASPTGAASEAEYLEIGLAERTDPAAVRAALDEALPTGLDVLEVVESAGGSLSDLLEASVWRTTVPDLSPAEAADVVAAFLAADAVPVERMTKKGLRTFDCRAAVVSLTSASQQGPGGECAILDMVLRHGTPSVRPDDVLAGLRNLTGTAAETAPLHERLAQGPLDPQLGTVGDPLALNRDTA
jgi:radical SAM-linked protein